MFEQLCCVGFMFIREFAIASLFSHGCQCCLTKFIVDAFRCDIKTLLHVVPAIGCSLMHIACRKSELELKKHFLDFRNSGF